MLKSDSQEQIVYTHEKLFQSLVTETVYGLGNERKLNDLLYIKIQKIIYIFVRYLDHRLYKNFN